MGNKTSKPRVVYLCSWKIEPYGKGKVNFVYDQIQEISNFVSAFYIKGKSVSIFKYIWLKIKGEDIVPLEVWPQDQVNVYEIRFPRWPTKITGRTHLEDLKRAAPYVAQRFKNKFGAPDLVHLHVILPTGILAAGISRSLNVPLLYQEHSGPFEMHTNTEEKRVAVNEVCAQATMIAPVGTFLGDKIVPYVHDKSKIAIFPNLVRTDLFQVSTEMPSQNKILRLITVTNLQPVKRAEDFLEAIWFLKEQYMPVMATIVSTGDNTKLSEMIRDYGVTENTRILPRLSKSELSKEMAKAHIYVCSSETETFGLAPAEALSTGRPVVTTDCGGPTDFIDKTNGKIVPVRNPKKLAQGIQWVWERIDSYKPENLSRKIEERYGPSAFCYQVINTYRYLIHDGL